MGTIAQKLQKALENKQLIVDSVNAKAGTSYDINSKPSDIADTITNIETGSNGLPIEVNELPTLGTAVPTSGMIEKVYVNTSLSTQEVINILETLTFVPYQGDTYIWACLADSTMTNGLAVTRFQEGNSFIYYIVSTINNKMTTLFTYANGSGDGWSSDFNGVVEFNIENQLELIAPNLGFTPENEKAKNLFSITPVGTLVEGAIYKTLFSSKSSAKGTTVPNSGYAENIYVNTKLSPKEVLDLFTSLDFYKEQISQNNYFNYFAFVSADENESNGKQCWILIQNNEIVIYYIGKDLSYTILAYGESATSELGFNGWNPDFNGIIPINQNLTDGQFEDIKYNYVGILNDKLTDLFSMTPYGKEYHLYEKEKFTQLIPEDELQGEPLVVDKLPGSPEEVVTDTYVENIYFNTKLSNNEVDKILETLTYEYNADNVGGYMIYWVDTERYVWDSLIVYDSRKISGVAPFTIGTFGNGTIYSSDTGFVEGFNGVFEVNSNICSTIEGQEGIAGLENSKLVNLISTTPFDGDIDINPNSIYLLKKDAEVWVSDGGELLNFGELAKEEGATFEIYFVKDIPLAENMLPSSEFEAYIYWVETENDGYLLMDGQVVKYSETLGENMPIIGVVTSLDEIIGDGMYILKPNTNKYYKYENGWVELIRQENEFFKVSELPNDIAPIPNSGNIYKLYFNKELSFEEIYNILSSLTYMDLSSFGLPYPAYIVFASMLTETACLIVKVENSYALMIIPEFFSVLESGQLDTTLYSYLSVYKDESGFNGTWNENIDNPKYIDNYYDLRDEVLSSFEGLELGSENEKLKDLFYIRTKGESFNGAIYKVGKEPKVVPNSGHIDKVYFNTSLSVEEVDNLIKNNLTFGGNLNIHNCLLYAVSEELNLGITELEEGGWVIVQKVEDAGQTYFAIYSASSNFIGTIYSSQPSSNEELGFYGWNPQFNGMLEINYSAFADLPEGDTQTLFGTKAGEENAKVVELFSLTPFKKDYYLCKNGKFDEMVIPEGTLEITENGEHNVSNYESVNVQIESGKPEQEKSITPTTSVQEVTPDSGYALSKVTVGAIPSEYVIPTGTLEVTSNGTHDVTNYKSVNVIVASSGSGEDMLQTKVNVTNSCDYLFYNYTGDNVDYISGLDTSNVTNMERMFYNCTSLITIPLLNTSKVDNMSSMFYGCSKLTSVPQLNTSKCISMSYMFTNCKKLETIPQLDTSNVTTMNDMFSSCLLLTTIPQLDTSNVTDMKKMFMSCHSLTTIPQLNTSNVTDMSYMLYQCIKLTTIPQLDTSNVTTMNSIFSGCTNLTSVPQLNTSKVTNMYQMFYNCLVLETIDITYYNISSTSSASYFAYGCSVLKSLIIREFGANYVLSTNSFNNSGISSGTGYIYVPRSMVDTLKSATNWSTYALQIRALEDYTIDGTTTGVLDETKI